MEWKEAMMGMIVLSTGMPWHKMGGLGETNDKDGLARTTHGQAG